MTLLRQTAPEGARDILFEECRAQREVQARLSRIFSMRGCREVSTPGLEYFDLFNLPGAAIPQQEMYKCTDRQGRLLVFRPDSTLPIARMAASRLQNEALPLRLFYSQRIYRSRPELSGRSAECAQMGIELLGASGLRADLEVISTAADALSACVPDFRVEIGHAGFFQSIARELPLPEERLEALRAVIESKNYGALGELLDPLGDLPAAAAMKRLPRLFGGEEALREAESLFPSGEAAQTLSYLKSLYRALESLGLKDRLMVDLGLVQRNDYYTGVVFSAYLQGHGDAVLMGGRYDRLCGKFGTPMPAVGFALDLDAVASRITGMPEKERRPAILVYGEPGCEARAQRLVREFLSQGTACECSLWDTWEESLTYAKRVGIAKAVLVTPDGTEEKLLEGGGKP